jgi:hypothetical protein
MRSERIRSKNPEVNRIVLISHVAACWRTVHRSAKQSMDRLSNPRSLSQFNKWQQAMIKLLTIRKPVCQLLRSTWEMLGEKSNWEGQLALMLQDSRIFHENIVDDESEHARFLLLSK